MTNGIGVFTRFFLTYTNKYHINSLWKKYMICILKNQIEANASIDFDKRYGGNKMTHRPEKENTSMIIYLIVEDVEYNSY